MKNIAISILLTIPLLSTAQITYGDETNTQFHQFLRNGVGAAVYINQVSSDPIHAILRLSSGTKTPNQNVRFTVQNDGSVGIGTISPEASLHVYRNATTGNWGSSTLTNAGIRIQDSGASLYIDGNTLYTDAVMNIGTINNNYVSLGTNDTERVRINTNGSVGIGTSNTFGYKLAVNGTIGATEVKVENTSAWPDFVFDPSYSLRTLEEVETYIAENKHLPEIPSDTEVNENGINLGEMNAKLLQKIEELTLYLIEQNKEIKELKELTTQQQAEIEQLKKE